MSLVEIFLNKWVQETLQWGAIGAATWLVNHAYMTQDKVSGFEGSVCFLGALALSIGEKLYSQWSSKK